MSDVKVCDCGHEPSPHHDFTTGYGSNHLNRTFCYECAGKLDRFYLGQSDAYTGYLSSGGMVITNWPGTPLMVVAAYSKGNNVIGGSITRVWALDEDGNPWFGQGAGKGMIITMRRMKHRSKGVLWPSKSVTDSLKG